VKQHQRHRSKVNALLLLAGSKTSCRRGEEMKQKKCSCGNNTFSIKIDGEDEKLELKETNGFGFYDNNILYIICLQCKKHYSF
jgi:hypothetical protein